MSTYKELVAQANALLEQAEQARKAELAAVISDIKQKIREHGLSASDLGLSGGKKSRSPKVPAAVKYRGANGEVWAGGKGRRPEWVRKLQAEGKNIEDYRV